MALEVWVGDETGAGGAGGDRGRGFKPLAAGTEFPFMVMEGEVGDVDVVR